MTEYIIEEVLHCFDKGAALNGGRMLTLTRWNGAEQPVYDLRDWKKVKGELLPEEGITLNEDAARTLCGVLEHHFMDKELSGLDFSFDFDEVELPDLELDFPDINLDEGALNI